MLPSAIAKTERKEKFGVLLREHRLGRPPPLAMHRDDFALGLRL